MRSFEDITVVDFWKVFRAKYPYILAAMFLAGVVAYAVSKYMIKPTYMAQFTVYAWEGAKGNTPGEHTNNEMIMAERSMIFSSRLMKDYEELLNSPFLKKKVLERLENDEAYKDLKILPYSLEASFSKESHFLACKVYSGSREMAYAAAQVTELAFIDAVEKYMGLAKVQPLDNPELLSYPVSPKKKLNAAVAAVAGGLLVFFAFFLFDFYHDILSSPAKIASDLKLSTLGTLFSYRGEQSGEKKDEKQYLLIRNDQTKPLLSALYEKFQLLLTNLQYALPAKRSANILLFTSTMPGDGKSFISANVAFSLAEKGKRVLLIGCDIRKPTLHELFEMERGIGLVNVIFGDKTVDEVMHKRMFDLPLDLIISGPIPPNPVRAIEMFHDSNFLNELKDRYDYIILDSPPTIEMADVYLLGKLVDGIVLVANAKTTPTYLVKDVVEKMRNFHFNILGVILNRYHLKSSGFGYIYGGGRGYENYAYDAGYRDKSPYGYFDHSAKKRS